jgi:ribonuclease HII
MHTYDPTGYDAVCGSDEAGLGAWAGDLLVAAVLAPVGWKPPHGLGDSKQVKEADRERLYTELTTDPSLLWAVQVSPPAVIDAHNVHTRLLHSHETLHRDLTAKVPSSQRVLRIADGSLALGFNIQSIPKADTFVPTVSAASIIAKVTRDRTMIALSKQFPAYGFEHHKGYGTKAHEEALAAHGICPVHRRSYGPIARLAAKAPPATDLLDLLCELPQE